MNGKTLKFEALAKLHLESSKVKHQEGLQRKFNMVFSKKKTVTF